MQSLSWKLAIGILIATLLPAVAADNPVRVEASGTCDARSVDIDDQELRFLALLNDYRAANGRGPLTISPALSRSAAWMAEDLSRRSDFGHDDSLGRTAHQRIADCGYVHPSGENIAAGPRWESADAALAAWQRSAPHDQNMLDARYVQVGVARAYREGSRYGWYWVTTFGTVADDSAALTAAAAPTPAPGTAPVRLSLLPGANLVTWPGPRMSASEAAARSSGVVAIYAEDPAGAGWLRFLPGAPDYLNTLPVLEPGGTYWVVGRTATTFGP